MKIVREWGRDDLAKVYVVDTGRGLVEMVESLQPPLRREEKWVLIVSTLYGCPVRCLMCDAGGEYKGKLSADEILWQIETLVRRRFPSGYVPMKKFKVQFARMGEPAFNPAVLDVLRKLPEVLDAPGLLPSISTIAPTKAGEFLQELRIIKDELYGHGRFQLQFSIHTTDPSLRDRLIPVRKWSFEEIAAYGEDFFKEGDRKITLNFAPARGYPINPKVLRDYFDPQRFLIKLTPLNPTERVKEEGLKSQINPFDSSSWEPLVEGLKGVGYEVLLSIGELDENLIGSNCGQYVSQFKGGLASFRSYERENTAMRDYFSASC